MVAADEASLPPQHRTAHDLTPVSGKPGTDDWGTGPRVDALLSYFDARAHWGKFSTSSLRSGCTRSTRGLIYFIALRRELDPQGMFLNDHLRPLFE